MKQKPFGPLAFAILLSPVIVFAQYYPPGYVPTQTSQAVFGGSATIVTTPDQTTSQASFGGETIVTPAASFGGSATIVSPISATAATLSDGDTLDTTCVNVKSEKLGFGSTDAATGGDVSAVQDFLIFKGLLDGTPTGYYGFKTFNAVMAYQKSKGITQVGRVGPLTKSLIKKDSCEGGLTSSVSSTKTTTTQTAQVVLPYSFTYDVTASAGKIVRVNMTLRGTTKPLGVGLKVCTKPVTSQGCNFDNEFSLLKDQLGAVYAATADTYYINKDVSSDNLPNVEYASFIRTQDGAQYELRWKVGVSTVSSVSTTVTTTSANQCAYQGPVFGGSPQCTQALAQSIGNSTRYGSVCSCGATSQSVQSSVASNSTVCSYQGPVFGGSPQCTQDLNGSTRYGSLCSCSIPPITPKEITINDSSTGNGTHLTRIKMTIVGAGDNVRACTAPGSSFFGMVGSTPPCSADSSFAVLKNQPGWSYYPTSDTYVIDNDVTGAGWPDVSYMTVFKKVSGETVTKTWR